MSRFCACIQIHFPACLLRLQISSELLVRPIFLLLLGRPTFGALPQSLQSRRADPKAQGQRFAGLIGSAWLARRRPRLRPRFAPRSGLAEVLPIVRLLPLPLLRCREEA